MTKSLKLSVCTFELVKMAQAKLEPNDASEQTLHFHPVPLLLKSPKFLKLKLKLCNSEAQGVLVELREWKT